MYEINFIDGNGYLIFHFEKGQSKPLFCEQLIGIGLGGLD